MSRETGLFYYNKIPAKSWHKNTDFFISLFWFKDNTNSIKIKAEYFMKLKYNAMVVT